MLNKKRFKRAKIPKSFTFLSKLYDILNDEQCKDIIHWNNTGNAIFIVDISKLCEIVLPKYYKHTNYSSFVRQLNMYGFNKKKGELKEELIFEHDKFNKKCTKDQIKEIAQEKRKMKLAKNYINYSQLSNDLNLSDSNDTNIFKILLNKYEENKNDINELKKEIENLRQINNNLITKIQFFKEKLYGHSIFLQKILLNKNETICSNKTKSKNLKELLKKYLYYMRIYSPYVKIKGNRTEKVHSFKIGSMNMNNNKIEIYNSNINIKTINNIHNINYSHSESIDDLSFINSKINDSKYS